MNPTKPDLIKMINQKCLLNIIKANNKSNVPKKIFTVSCQNFSCYTVYCSVMIVAPHLVKINEDHKTRLEGWQGGLI